MAVFTPDFAAVDAGFPIYDKGLYRLKITAHAPTIYEKSDEDDPDTKVQVARIRYKMEMFGRFDDNDELVSEDENGKSIRGKAVQAMDVYTHSQGGWSFAKSFLMAACGFRADEENEANELLFIAENWTFSGDPEDPEEELRENMGNYWNLPIDRFVDVYLSKETRQRDDGSYQENQKFSQWRPVGERAEL